MIYISKAVFDEILDHAKESYPDECCGVIAGKPGPERTVEKAYRTENTNKVRSRDRYEIDPAALLKLDRKLREEGLDILGFYHSHPDHPDSPSVFDRERGQPGYSYLIVAVNGERETTVKSWSFEEDDEPFGEEEIKLI